MTSQIHNKQTYSINERGLTRVLVSNPALVSKTKKENYVVGVAELINNEFFVRVLGYNFLDKSIPAVKLIPGEDFTPSSF